MDSSCNSDDEYESDDALLYELAALTRQTLRELTLATVLCPLENSLIINLEAELNQLRERKNLLEEDLTSTKRKRWCSWCLQEAIYLSKNNKFYCCSQCEQLDILLSDE